MGYENVTIYTVGIASGATLSSAATISRGWKTTYLVVPTMVSNTQFHVQGSHDGVTYRRICHPSLNSSTVATNDFAIVSGATNRIVPIANGFFGYKIETTATVDSGQTFKIICCD